MRTSKNRKIFSANNEQGTRIFVTNGPHIADLHPFSAPQYLLALRFDCAGVNFRMFVK